MTAAEQRANYISRIRMRALLIGIIAGIIYVIGGLFDPSHFFRSYLYAFVFWTFIALGGLAVSMLHHLTGGAWGYVIRRIMEAASMTLPLMILLFIPLCFGLPYLYQWTHPDLVAHDPVMWHRRGVENAPWYIVRGLLYLILWSAMALTLRRWSLAQDRTGDPALTQRFQLSCGPLLIVYAFSVSLACVDWLMSLEPHWYSTMFAFIMICTQGLIAIAFGMLIAQWLAGRRLLAESETRDAFHDLGGMLLAFVVLWAYTAYGQYIIIWSGDLPRETTFYLHRGHGGWQWVGFWMIIFHFALPFFLLLFGRMKRNYLAVAVIALMILIAMVVNTFWLVEPTFHPGGFYINWFDVVAPIAMGGIWLAVFSVALQGPALIPLRDPRLEEMVNRRAAVRAREELERGTL